MGVVPVVTGGSRRGVGKYGRVASGSTIRKIEESMQLLRVVPDGVVPDICFLLPCLNIELTD